MALGDAAARLRMHLDNRARVESQQKEIQQGTQNIAGQLDSYIQKEREHEKQQSLAKYRNRTADLQEASLNFQKRKFQDAVDDREKLRAEAELKEERGRAALMFVHDQKSVKAVEAERAQMAQAQWDRYLHQEGLVMGEDRDPISFEEWAEREGEPNYQVPLTVEQKEELIIKKNAALMYDKFKGDPKFSRADAEFHVRSLMDAKKKEQAAQDKAALDAKKVQSEIDQKEALRAKYVTESHTALAELERKMEEDRADLEKPEYVKQGSKRKPKNIGSPMQMRNRGRVMKSLTNFLENLDVKDLGEVFPAYADDPTKMKALSARMTKLTNRVARKKFKEDYANLSERQKRQVVERLQEITRDAVVMMPNDASMVGPEILFKEGEKEEGEYNTMLQSLDVLDKKMDYIAKAKYRAIPPERRKYLKDLKPVEQKQYLEKWEPAFESYRGLTKAQIGLTTKYLTGSKATRAKIEKQFGIPGRIRTWWRNMGGSGEPDLAAAYKAGYQEEINQIIKQMAGASVSGDEQLRQELVNASMKVDYATFVKMLENSQRRQMGKLYAAYRSMGRTSPTVQKWAKEDILFVADALHLNKKNVLKDLEASYGLDSGLQNTSADTKSTVKARTNWVMQ